MFLDELKKIDLKHWCEVSSQKTTKDVEIALNADKISLHHISSLISPAAEPYIEQMAQRSRNITLKRFGKTIQLYTPIYLSNYCSNGCLYCGFRKGSGIKRKLQTIEEVEAEADFLKKQGFQNLLLVAGDDPKVDIDYLTKTVKHLHTFIPFISLEIAPKTINEYKLLKEAGVEGIIIYQETYEKELYTHYHPSGKKSSYEHRLETAEKIGISGIHRIGIGALLGLGNYAYEALSIFSHANYLIKKFWGTEVTISLPRMREAKGSIEPPNPVNNFKFTQLVTALRIALPDVGILLSTREDSRFRDSLVRIGITQISAGSKTEPGGYLMPNKSSEQFAVEDRRSVQKVVKDLKTIGYDPVWKDWEGVLNDPVSC